MREPVERLREKAQNEKTAIGLSELLRLAKEENQALLARVARLEEALKEISTLYWVDAPAPEEMRRNARRALEEK